ncbi:MFS general substrate transporter [Clathrospora elynae]|uniref:MFS general substrate transporter n=1 Tax=Clathrospora elynae TaxID=706981 RepID=A0A6A5SE07_9PLEO|nr:MFS general substrate transporter [Clathrospora elynae]
MAPYAEEKGNVTALERIGSDTSITSAAIAHFTPEQQKKSFAKSISVLSQSSDACTAYRSWTARTNLGVAMVTVMGVFLKFTGERYSLTVLLFFIAYVPLRPPATVVLRQLRSRIFSPAVVVLWGLVIICFGLIKNWHELLPFRLLLGIFEADFFPGSACLLSCWYKRFELQKRNTMFYLIGMLSSAFSGILGYFFSLFSGHSFQAAYLLGVHHGPTKKALQPPSSSVLGVLTVAISLIGWYFIKKFLEQDEADFIVARIEQDRHDVVAEEFNLKNYLVGALDLKSWGFAPIFMFTITMTYAIAYFLPIIIKDGVGFSPAAVNCLIAPPDIFSALYHIRFPWIIANGLLALIGLPFIGFPNNVGVQYFRFCLATAATNSNIFCIFTWQANNIRGQWKRALCSATLVGAASDAPNYLPGIVACTIAAGLIVVVALLADAEGKVIERMEGLRYTL